ncbi:bifunctional DNA-formamidopyrimidine glycosylase/DNA-(apurinic or apyrimidinic site) lyase [Erysipelothrix urinaevulpis]|uniref:bifunctional DNA-formamidopyrimidine glycosylase/DNA-(apurinic or apyrimidinic site) lyase n=1 Tax=Erysipelothrix urinaevulpis TaxID=2683717 RepID=UPI001359ADFC|nr:bifunctional DNA-formamidopyrimidine glycosylase/DNA-(apurinic or apyrimidinic site) lyase [Erysipelothrix urinaevulpis]
MPELPEVETIVRTLERSLLNETILGIEFLYPDLLEQNSSYDLKVLQGKTFTKFDRRGKYLIFEFDHSLYWVLHLRMEGKFHLYQENIKPTKHTHLIIQTTRHWIHYLDVRKFSRMAVVDDLDSYMKTKNLGLEPFDSNLTPDYLKEKMGKSGRSLKTMLLDQSIVSGIGNIYADEILFATKLHPLRKGPSLKMRDYRALCEEIPKILEAAILQGGTTIRSYTSALNVNGLFQVSLKAYGQKGEPCVECQTTMEAIKVSGRTTVFCKRCQK